MVDKLHEVGGVTVTELVICRHVRGNEFCRPIPILTKAVPRDATTVLSQVTFGQYYRPKPTEVYPRPLRVVNLGTPESPYFQGHRWLPAALTTKVRVLTPVLNGPCHDSKWGLRRVTGEEILMAKDVSVAQIKSLAGFTRDDAFLLGIAPGKCLTAGYQALVNGGVRFLELKKKIGNKIG